MLDRPHRSLGFPLDVAPALREKASFSGESKRAKAHVSSWSRDVEAWAVLALPTEESTHVAVCRIPDAKEELVPLGDTIEVPTVAMQHHAVRGLLPNLHQGGTQGRPCGLTDMHEVGNGPGVESIRVRRMVFLAFFFRLAVLVLTSHPLEPNRKRGQCRRRS